MFTLPSTEVRYQYQINIFVSFIRKDCEEVVHTCTVRLLRQLQLIPIEVISSSHRHWKSWKTWKNENSTVDPVREKSGNFEKILKPVRRKAQGILNAVQGKVRDLPVIHKLKFQSIKNCNSICAEFVQ